MSIAILPTRATADALWERYAALVRQAQAEPALLLNRQHAEQMIAAHAAFADAFLKSERPC